MSQADNKIPDGPKKVTVVVDNDSWILSHAHNLVEAAKELGNSAQLCRAHDEIQDGDVCFYLGCVKITPPEILAKNKRNLVAHASDLPQGRGFSPWTYAILEGENKIPLCLLEAIEEVDAGPIIYKEYLSLSGTELVEETRELLGQKIFEICKRFLSETPLPEGQPQEGEPTYHDRRTPSDSEVDPQQTIAEQFDLLRVVDNEKYPAFFQHRGKKYKLKIEEMP